MDAEEIKAIAEHVSEHVILKLDERYARKEVVSTHQKILKGENGDEGLTETVRFQGRRISLLEKIGIFISSAITIEFLGWLLPKIGNFLNAAATP